MSDGGYGSAYGSAEYAASLPHQGAPLALPLCGAHLVRRPIEGVDRWDASAPYPLLSPARPGRLADDLAALEGGGERPVTVTAVVDPLVGATAAQLRAALPHHLRPYKRHFLADLDRPLDAFVSSHHRRDMRRGLRNAEVDVVAFRGDVLARWIELYDALVERHGIRGPAAFPPESFEALAEVPGLRAFAARMGGRIVGMQLWLTDQRRAWYHLAATDLAGYRAGASYALMGGALRTLAELGVEVAQLGGSAAVGPDDEDDGLARFKRGWSSRSEIAYLGGRVCDPERYRTLCGDRDDSADWFPPYRRPADR